jgi:hypothetical protein
MDLNQVFVFLFKIEAFLFVLARRGQVFVSSQEYSL